jgi:hypothetical protein
VIGVKSWLALLAALVLAASAGAASSAPSLAIYPVPQGGFSLGLPPTWGDLTSTVRAPRANGKTPTMAEIAQTLASHGDQRLIVIDPAANGAVYADVVVDYVGPVNLGIVESATKSGIEKAFGKKALLSSAKVKLGTLSAYALSFAYTAQKVKFEASVYVVAADQVEYAIRYVAPRASWAKYSALFAASARTFKLLAPPKLAGDVLSAAEVGAGYKGSVIPRGGTFLGGATLDLCAGAYPSESLRTGRLQMSYVHAGKAVRVSNEVVTYVPGGAQEALREVRAVAKSCARKPAVVTQGKVKTTTEVAPIHDPNLLPGSVAVRIHVHQPGSRPEDTTGVAIYQVKNNVLSGVYAWVNNGTTLAQAEKIAYRAAETSERKLGGTSLAA